MVLPNTDIFPQFFDGIQRHLFQELTYIPRENLDTRMVTFALGKISDGMKQAMITALHGIPWSRDFYTIILSNILMSVCVFDRVAMGN